MYHFRKLKTNENELEKLENTREDASLYPRVLVIHFWTLDYGQTDTDQPTDRPTNGQTDTASYRDARTHVKMSYRRAEGPIDRSNEEATKKLKGLNDNVLLVPVF